MVNNPSKPSSNSFRWICFGTAVIFGMVLLVLIWDLKQNVNASLNQAQQTISEANEAIKVVNQKLPEIVDEVKKGTATLSSVAEDVELIKSVAGIQSGQDRGVRSLAIYADEVQQTLIDQTADMEATILIEEIFGSDLKEVESIDEFLVGLNREMVAVILPLAKSKQEVLYRICRSSPPRRKPFFIQLGDAEPVSLEEFLKKHHPESAALPVYEP
ncbi:MAG: hypothetical protein ACKVH8_06195 [Pirellulales bacterium]|jgi:septal ring factor EnvC (AmiA/AmiB activator)